MGKVDTRALFGLAMVVLGAWMIAAAQWALAVTDRTICYVWWATTGLGGVALVGGLALALGTFSLIWQRR
jgi:hypothetical protein